MKKWINNKMASLYAAYTWQMANAQKKLADDRGDTNFISILILMAFVVLLAGVFIAFRDQIVAKVQAVVDSLNFGAGTGAAGRSAYSGTASAFGGYSYTP